MPAGTVEVFLIGAVGIKDTEVFGKADPYAVINCGRQKLRSNTASNQGSKPVWNQKFSFYVDDTANDLEIVIFNHNILKEDDELGRTKIPLAKVFAETKLPTTSYNVLRPSGRVQGEVKLSLIFTAKQRKGQQAPGGQQAPVSSMPGPYNAKTHGSPYAPAIPPEPPVKHDPLLGPDGYYKKDTKPAGSSHGGSSHYAYNSDSDSGSSKYSTPGYPQGYYPHAPPPPAQSPYGRSESNPGYGQSDSFSSHGRASSHSGYYPAAPTAPGDYSGRPPPEPSSPYGHGPPHLSGSLSHITSGFPKPGSGMKPPRFEDLAGKFGSLNVSGSSSHGNYPPYPGRPNEGSQSTYPPQEHDYHGYNPPPPNGGYGHPPPPAGYPPPYSSGSGNHSPHGSYGTQNSSSSFYPPQLGISGPPSGPPSDAYPPHPYYNGPHPDQYVPAGYPK